MTKKLSPDDRINAVMALLDGIAETHHLVSSACDAVRLAVKVYGWAGILTHEKIDRLFFGLVFDGNQDRVRFFVCSEVGRLDEVIENGTIEQIAARIFAMSETLGQDEAAYA